MVDLHCHILPGLDDGPRESEESIAMARLAYDRGTTRLIATPHCRKGGAGKVLESVEYMRQQLQCLDLPLKLYPGMEIFATEQTPQLLQEGKLLTLNGSRYPLVEFDFEGDGRLPGKILQELRDAGYRPIIAHPERYIFLQQDPRLLNEWVDLGCLLQLNTGSLTGRFGPVCQDLAFSLVDRGFASAVASDAHGFDRRRPRLDRAWELLAHSFSPTAAAVLLEENPKKILKNESIQTPRLVRF